MITKTNEQKKAIMARWRRCFLFGSLVSIVIGLGGSHSSNLIYLGIPVGVVLFGLFLIAQVLEEESALYDEQNRAPAPVSQTGQAEREKFQEVAHHPALTKAYPH